MTVTYSKSDFEESKANYSNLTVERTDRNGTEYISAIQSCWKCMGNKIFDCWGHVANGVCFACNGSGFNNIKIKVMTDEHYNKLAEKKALKIQKEREERIANSVKVNEEFLIDRNFSKEGKAYVVYGDTYSIKDELKSKGAKFFNSVWYFAESHSEYDCIEVDAENCFNKNEWDNCYCGWKNYYENELLVCVEKRKESERLALAEKTEYFGNVGDKISNITVTLEKEIWYDTQFGSMSIYIFKDSEGHTFKWNTSTCLLKYGMDSVNSESVVREGDTVNIKATIKEHSEYKNEKQTVITRVKCVA